MIPTLPVLETPPPLTGGDYFGLFIALIVFCVGMYWAEKERMKDEDD